MRLLFRKTSQHKLGALLGLALAVCLSGCTSKNPLLKDAPAVSADAQGTQVIAPTGLNKLFGYISPYRMTIQQGNFVSQEMISQLKNGMTREQVRFLLGTALLTDMFHEDRWDYPFRLLKPNGELVTSRVTVFFKSNTVERFEGGNLPTEKDYLAHISTSAIGMKAESSLDLEAPKKK
ncbi:outer membrane protein assembly factor BamE [Undibacterium piscinae]|uniref:Outer membrane protein assembly factor BamE n=1 Tax=Undibacterium piscinae TaxID=2495591 RepID=A0A6M4A8J8_9BURK|nr:outer membrane protein assembly factor BamE [Undibacterium piscinae]